MMHVQEYLKTHTLDQLTQEHGVVVKAYDELYVLNYSQLFKTRSAKLNADQAFNQMPDSYKLKLLLENFNG